MRVFISTVLACSLIAIEVLAGPLTYDVGVINLRSDATMSDYVVTGTITTNGALGELAPSDIISWSITVDGPRPYTFHPGNPGGYISPSVVVATSNSLTTFGSEGWLWLYANENTLPNCSNCQQALGWTTGIQNGLVAYYYFDDDSDPSFAPAGARVGSPFTYATPIATRVPEPSSLLLVVIVLVISLLGSLRLNKNALQG